MSFRQSRWDPVTAKLINAYPRPTSSALANNLVTTPTRTQDWNQFDVRVDHTHSANNNFLGRYSRSETATVNPYTFPQVQLAGVSNAVGIGNEDTFAGPSELLAEHAVLGWVHVFSPRVVLDSRVGYNHFNLEFTQATWSQATNSASSSVFPTPISRKARTDPDLQPGGVYGHRSQPFPADLPARTHLPDCLEPDVCQRQAHAQGGRRHTPTPHGRVSDESGKWSVQLLIEHYQ